MSQNEQAIEWYLARDGQRHGPISDLEMRKIREYGHLKPTDLVWRQGFANWETAASVFPAPPPRPQPPPPAPPAAATARAAPQPPHPGARAPAPPHAQVPSANPMAVRQAEAATPTSVDPLRHRRMPAPGPDPQTQRASGYGNVPYYPQPMGPGAAPFPEQPPTGRPAPQPMAQPGTVMPAGGAMPPRPGDPVPAPRLPSLAPASAGAPELVVPSEVEVEDDDEPGRRFPWKLVASLIAIIAIGGAVFGLVKTGRISLSSLPFLSSAPGGQSGGPKALPVVKAPKESFKEPPLKSFAGGPSDIDAGFQKSALWQLLKKEFPDWYNERVKETAALRADSKADPAIAAQLARAMVELRRKNAAEAFAASPLRLRAVAQTFVDNLARLSGISTEACYRFISSGETDPMMIELMRTPDHAASMQAQMIAVFEAIVDGRRTKRQIAPAERKDYELLANQLSLRGWSPADLALFDDARALSRAPPQKVCQMVQDWFAAQLAIKDEAVQTRLFGATLKPLIGE